MKGINSSREKIVTDEKAIALLMHPQESIYLKPFMTKAVSISAAAKKLKLDMNYLYYRVKRFEKAGILEKVGSQKRQGRAICYYQASAKSFFVPFSASKSETVEQFLANHDAHWQPALSKGIAKAYKLLSQDLQDWGARIDMSGELMSFGIEPLHKVEKVRPKGIINYWDTRHYLSDEDVKSMTSELNAVLKKYLKKDSGPRKVLHLALADWSDD